jgi:ADP-L-glycero-D-manno-heptose 6-epimerase
MPSIFILYGSTIGDIADRAAEFIGSCLLGCLNQQGFEQIIISDEFSRADKLPNYSRKKYSQQVERDELFDWLSKPIGY